MHSRQSFAILTEVLVFISKTSASVIPPTHDDAQQVPEGFEDKLNNYTWLYDELMSQHPAYPFLQHFTNPDHLIGDNDTVPPLNNDNTTSLSSRDVACKRDGHRNDTLSTRDEGCSDPDDKVPINELPPCYYECMVENCCNMWIGGPGNVSEMTTYEFCHSKWFYVGNWIFDKVVHCLGKKCDSCKPKCVDESDAWMGRVCGKH